MSSSSWRRKKPPDDKAQLKSQNASCKLQSEEKSGARIQNSGGVGILDSVF
jgi:hypothetical protein